MRLVLRTLISPLLGAGVAFSLTLLAVAAVLGPLATWPMTVEDVSATDGWWRGRLGIMSVRTESAGMVRIQYVIPPRRVWQYTLSVLNDLTYLGLPAIVGLLVYLKLAPRGLRSAIAELSRRRALPRPSRVDSPALARPRSLTTVSLGVLLFMIGVGLWNCQGSVVGTPSLASQVLEFPTTMLYSMPDRITRWLMWRMGVWRHAELSDAESVLEMSSYTSGRPWLLDVPMEWSCIRATVAGMVGGLPILCACCLAIHLCVCPVFVPNRLQCPACGYSLEGAVTAFCPECGLDIYS